MARPLMGLGKVPIDDLEKEKFIRLIEIFREQSATWWMTEVNERLEERQRDREKIFRNENLREDIFWSQYPMLADLKEGGKNAAHCSEGVLRTAGFWPSNKADSERATAALYYHMTVGIMDIIDDTLPSPTFNLHSRTEFENSMTDTSIREASMADTGMADATMTDKRMTDISNYYNEGVGESTEKNESTSKVESQKKEKSESEFRTGLWMAIEDAERDSLREIKVRHWRQVAKLKGHFNA